LNNSNPPEIYKNKYYNLCWLHQKRGLELFKGFLKSEFSEENVEFWSACEEFRSSGDANMHVFAQKIYDDFVAFTNIIKQPTILEQYHSKKPLTEKVAWFMMFNATFSNISVISSPPTRKDNSNYKWE
jgi:hypothetical protein